MAKITWTPWLTAMSVRLRQDDWQSLEPGAGRKNPAVWQPAVDAYACEQGLTLTVDLPGLRLEDLRLEIQGRRLLLSGERRPPEAAPQGRGVYQLLERPHGPFSRCLHLPAGLDASRASAVLRDGQLTVSIPRAAACANRRIEVCCPGG